MKRTGPAGRAKPVHMRRVHTENTEHTRRYPPPLNATSINSAADTPLHANDCRPDLGISMPADTDPPTTPSLFAALPVAL